MKKLLLLSLATVLTFSLSAQSQRKVLLEHFTQASCGPCATYNPNVEAYLNANPTQAVAIKYQVWWPGSDPMYNHNTADVQARAGYYSVQGVPNSVIDGNYYNDHPATPFPNGSGNSAMMTTRSAVPSPFDIAVTHSFSNNYNKVNVSATITASQAYNNSNLKAHIVVVEKHIHFDQPAGSNGEKDFYNVMKKMLPSASGTSLQAVWAAGNSVTLTESWTHSNVYDVSQLAVVVFVQDDATKEVFQAAFSENIGLPYANDVAAVGTEEMTVCKTAFTPTVTVQNFGNANVNNFTVQYNINNGGNATYNWTGVLTPLQKVDVTLPAIPYSFLSTGNNDLNVKILNPNGAADQFAGNDETTGTIKTSPLLTETMTVRIRTDNYGYETYWEIYDVSNGTVYGSGGNPKVPTGTAAAGDPGAYGNNQLVNTTVVVPANACYQFKIYDDYGDGMCCAFGNGFYRIFDNANTLVLDGGTFGTDETKDFEVQFPVSTDLVTLKDAIKVFPNPAYDHVTVEFDLTEAENLDIFLMNTMGQVLRHVASEKFNMGNHFVRINTADLPAGMYFISIKNEDTVVTKRVVVQK